MGFAFLQHGMLQFAYNFILYLSNNIFYYIYVSVNMFGVYKDVITAVLI